MCSVGLRLLVPRPRSLSASTSYIGVEGQWAQRSGILLSQSQFYVVLCPLWFHICPRQECYQDALFGWAEAVETWGRQGRSWHFWREDGGESEVCPS